ncbi:phosphoglycolate phosphatase [Actinobacillus vicugnae]|uniref:phosphoglycolate phosphatase n=1 Tax=Actinobacillus vicugnae TaxID=2573093 RepID=UPI0012407B55|nr:phosphoglycolate phosphatase [Actinobacillus vicugnae]
MASKYKVIGFDLDGTLVNTLPDLTLVVNSMFAEHGLPTTTQEKVLTWIGKGADIFFQNAIAYTGKIFDAQKLVQLRSSFDKYYATYICEESVLYPNVKATLETLKAQSYTLVVITNKPTKLVEPVLSAFGIYHLFSETLGGQSVPKIKPHPDPMLFICEKFAIQPSELLFVGDSENDVIASHAAGCDVVGLTYGYNYNVPIEQSNPTFVTSEFADVLKIVS